LVYFPSFVALAFRNELDNRNDDFKNVHPMTWLHRIKFGEVWSSNSGVWGCTPLVDQQFGYTFAWRRHC